MSTDKGSLVVCVLALVHGEQDEVLPEDLRVELFAAGGQYDIRTKGHVYTDSRDGWSPFIDSDGVRGYLENAGFEIFSSSFLLEEIDKPEKWQELVKKTQLFVIDPVFLGLKSFRDYILKLDGILGGSYYKNYCLIIPDRMPEKARKRLRQVCGSTFSLLPTNDHRDTGWNIESSDRLNGFLNNLSTILKIDLVFDRYGTPRPDMSAPPSMGG